ncbi:MAG TPA: hypothetical protein VMY76_13900 [Gemmatimonadales bacterium]|nr:hypothetical protein [Gemmatimonadales bacterium]
MTLHLSAGIAGLRILTVTIGQTGRPLSASDHVYFRLAVSDEPGAPAMIRQESIGGRLEADGSFRGTCWLVTGPEPTSDEEPQWSMEPRPPSTDETEKLKALVGDLMRRLG